MTATHQFGDAMAAITAGSGFNCGLFARNRSAACWGDETGSRVISLTPTSLRFLSISAGGFHVCGILENSLVYCWGTSIKTQQSSSISAPMDPMVSVVGGRFHTCGIERLDRRVLCWGFMMPNNSPPPSQSNVFAMAAGDYFTCCVMTSLKPLYWGTCAQWQLPIAVSPGVCNTNPCGPGSYEFGHANPDGKPCRPVNSKICIPCSSGCPEGSYLIASCNSTSDRKCQFNCSSCGSPDCSSFCTLPQTKPKSRRFVHVFVAELVFVVVLVSAVSILAYLYE